jgi:T4-like virus Myoviridae tail sheath stabiliser
MLPTSHYYHRIIRKLVVSFGSMFNDMRLVRYDQSNNGNIEIERINVPLMYASKEKFYMRISNSPDLLNPMNLTLPRMAFEMNGISYDPLRKISGFTDQFAEGLPLGLKKVKCTPYNFDFNLYIFVRNTEDGAQIVEQILPYFAPDYTLTIDFVDINELKMDVPVVFNSITYDDSHEGDPESTRSIIWTLNFTVKAYLFGPVADIKMIRKATSNIYDNTFETNPLKELVLVPAVANTNTGTYKIDELVYQGRDVGEATATGFVKKWNGVSNTIVVYDTNGAFRQNTILIGAVSGSKYNVASYAIDPNQMVKIEVTPTPNTANTEAEAFGFSTNIIEYT